MTHPTQADLAALQGTWQQTAMEEDGIPNPPDTHGAPGARLAVTATTFTVTAPDGHVLLEGTFELDATTTPKSITWIDSTGPDAGKRLPPATSSITPPSPSSPPTKAPPAQPPSAPPAA